MKLTFIGNGNMAIAMIESLYKKYDIEVLGRNREKLEKLNKKFDNKLEIFTYDDGFDITDKNILLCVKPYALKDVALHVKGTASTLISVLAGVSIEALKSNISAKHTIKAMPNIAAAFGKSMTTLMGDESFKAQAEDILSGIGQTMWMNSEKEFNIATALAGSGPAFLAIISEALTDGAVMEGLKRDDAKKLTEGLFEGFSSLLNEMHPATIKENVMSPGGVTAAGCGVLEEKNTRHAMIEAIKKAYEKTL